MARFLDIQGPNCRETLHHPQPNAILVSKKTVEENPEGEGAPAQEKPGRVLSKQE